MAYPILHPVLQCYNSIQWVPCRAAERNGYSWGMQVDWWLQPCAVFDHSSSCISYSICHINKVNSIAWLYRGAQPRDSIHYITLPPYISRTIACIFSGCQPPVYRSSNVSTKTGTSREPEVLEKMSDWRWMQRPEPEMHVRWRVRQELHQTV